MLRDMWSMRSVVEVFSPAGAARNAGAAIDADRDALAEVDSVVARLQRHAAAADRPAA
jgi:hypothetical protein